MEELEAAQTDLTPCADDLAETDERLAKVTEARDQRYADIDSELARIAAEREPVVAAVPADLLALYDSLRASKGGVGVAELRARECGGCMLSLDNADLGGHRHKARGGRGRALRAVPADPGPDERERPLT